jgi:hypothetical protein
MDKRRVRRLRRWVEVAWRVVVVVRWAVALIRWVVQHGII